jgi:anti-anti-sigma factor
MAHQQAVLAGRTSTVLPTPEVATLRCEGELGELELAALADELFRLVNRGRRCLVIDLSGVDHVDYRGVRPLAARARALRTAGGDLKLAGLSAYLAAIFRAAGVEQEFELYRTGEEARSAFASSRVFAARWPE